MITMKEWEDWANENSKVLLFKNGNLIAIKSVWSKW